MTTVDAPRVTVPYNDPNVPLKVAEVAEFAQKSRPYALVDRVKNPVKVTVERLEEDWGWFWTVRIERTGAKPGMLLEAIYEAEAVRCYFAQREGNRSPYRKTVKSVKFLGGYKGRWCKKSKKLRTYGDVRFALDCL